MATITLRGDDAAFMQDLSAQLAQDLQRVGLDADVQLTTPSATEATRGDPAVLAIIATAVAAGGALTVFLGKDGGACRHWRRCWKSILKAARWKWLSKLMMARR
ncbi:MAG: hypothetical protein BWK73_51550 [Thiothrix lacustris]|uniref:Uncharacterized protein n=1 Tax=Thiothrix lacustris TaxID=525917 RepID=A0A1Y1Q844_9GAMM|nr:MAG: hypothetical protein BWK73_51550 [Thiothrix lacustris]